MSIYTMSRDGLIAKAERDDAAVRRAAAVLQDNAELQAQVYNLTQEISDLRADAKAAEKAKLEIKRLSDRLAKQEGACASEVARAKAEADELRAALDNAKKPKKEPKPPAPKVVTKRIEVPTPCPKQEAALTRAKDSAKAAREDAKAALAEADELRAALDKAKRAAAQDKAQAQGEADELRVALDKAKRVAAQDKAKAQGEADDLRTALDRAKRVAAQDKAKAQAEADELRAALDRAKRPKKEPKPLAPKVVTKRVEVPTPCPKQEAAIIKARASAKSARQDAKAANDRADALASQVDGLQSELAKFKKYDMADFEKWRRMVDIARGAK